MRADNLQLKSRSPREWNRLRKLSCGDLYLVALFDESIGECSEKRDVRRVCKIDPETHCSSPLDLDEPAAIAQRRFGSFDHVHEAQSCWSICLGLLVVFDAVDEMQRFGL